MAASRSTATKRSPSTKAKSASTTKAAAKRPRAAATKAAGAAKSAAKRPSTRAAGTKARSKRPSDALSKDELVGIYRTMVLARRFEELVIELFREGVMPGFIHVAIGQEGIAAGAGHALGDDDYIGSTHRAHAHIIARGSSAAAMFAEMMGKSSGLCKGKGGSMHLSDMSRNVVGANGVVGAGAPMMTGVALAQKELGTGNVGVAFYGDGATNQGNVHEAMNLAQLWKLPVLFICENNWFAESTPYWQHIPVEDLAVRGLAFDMTTIKVDGNDVLAVYDAVTTAREHATSGEGPVYIVAETRRISGHYVGDAEVYRTKEDRKEAKAADPIPRFRKELLKRKVSEQAIADAEASVEDEITAAVAEARRGEAPKPEEAMQHVYVEYPYAGPVIGV